MTKFVFFVEFDSIDSIIHCAVKKVFCKTMSETIKNQFKKSKKIRFFSKTSRCFRMLLNASECIRMRPNTSEHIPKLCKTSMRSRKLAKQLRHLVKSVVHMGVEQGTSAYTVVEHQKGTMPCIN